MPALLIGMYLAVGMSICAGYHRFFSHRAYDASRPLQFFFAFFGAMAAQNSIYWWSAGHRIHHSYVDKDWDPYSIKRGFWWAHILWIFQKNEPTESTFDNVRDLAENPIVMWQHRWHKAILILGGFGIPTLIGWAFGDAVGGLLWGGFLRVFVIHHTTFFVNSLAHTLGKQSFSADVSARDNWLVALLTLGEGYHSFHHRFPADYRNGIRWFQWDPAKWFIGVVNSMGFAASLKTTPLPLIEQARMQAAMRDYEPHIDKLPERLSREVNERITRARASIDHSIALWRQHAQELANGRRRKSRQFRRVAMQRVKQARREWRGALRLLAQAA